MTELEQLRAERRKIDEAVTKGEMTRRKAAGQKAKLSRRINEIEADQRRQAEKARRAKFSQIARRAVETRRRNEAQMDPEELARIRSARARKAHQTRKEKAKVGV